MSTFTAIVLAGGSGSRMNSKVKKQYMDINGIPLIVYSLLAFDKSRVDDIILVVGKDDISFCEKEIVEKYGIKKPVKVIEGGSERYMSVFNGLKETDAEYVLIHDGARPYVNLEMIEASMDAVIKYKAVTVAVPAKDTIKIVDDEEFGVSTPDRSLLRNIQTPQSFDRRILVSAYERLFASDDDKITDDTMIVEKYAGIRVKAIMGDYKNIKVTTPEDIEIISLFLNESGR